MIEYDSMDNDDALLDSVVLALACIYGLNEPKAKTPPKPPKCVKPGFIPPKTP
jgi:hypothetical protein